MKKRSVILFLALTLCCLGLKAQSRSFERTGDILQYAIPAAAGLSTLVWDDGTKPEWQFAKGFVSTMAVSYALKFSINRQRPLGGNYSFPSGHTASAFYGAGFIHKRYGLKYGIPSYALAGLVAWSRVDADKHYWSDVAFGAFLGVLSSQIFTKKYNFNDVEMDVSMNSESIIIQLNF